MQRLPWYLWRGFRQLIANKGCWAGTSQRRVLIASGGLSEKSDSNTTANAAAKMALFLGEA